MSLWETASQRGQVSPKARCLAAALRGADALEAQELTVEEEVGFALLADGLECLQHLREAYSKR